MPETLKEIGEWLKVRDLMLFVSWLGSKYCVTIHHAPTCAAVAKGYHEDIEAAMASAVSEYEKHATS